MGLLVGGAACNKSASSDAASSDPKCGYKIALFGALTGQAANLGVPVEQSVQLAVDQHNQKMGSDCIQVAKFDSQGDPSLAPGVARSLVADKTIIGVVGPLFSGESEAADPILDSAGLPTITPGATETSLAAKGWKVFHRAVANNDTQGPAAAAYIKDVLKAPKVFVADDQSAYGAGLADQVKAKLGPIVVGSDKTEGDGKQTDFSPLVQKVKSSGAAAFFYGGYYANAGIIRKQLTAAGWTGTLVGGDGLQDRALARAAGNAAAAGTVTTCLCSPPEAAAGTFNDDYQARWHQTPGTYTDVAFDAANMLLQGIDGGGTTPDKLNAYLSTVNYQGVAKTYKFTPTGELDSSLIKVWTFRFDKSGGIQPDREIKLPA
ncbi:branched-chain amino acid ABC transporter substrate-binding protein [Actinoplanes sp. TBRC 11911]|uniref:branched-chain amino acid ABC transporter substrate-binding protein n=1 Tax=Actinoplanes sp. TBRC 11911 TaxID=2729386 RepID=UPI00289918C7|nr:branched-chain amino acid ABC transporter substrate-binding protein [Actinoplanes sp. TBRC 11911]